MVLFLYCVRKIHGPEYKRLTFPPRYHQMSKLEQSLCGSNEKHDQEIFDTIMDCFNPKMLPEINC